MQNYCNITDTITQSKPKQKNTNTNNNSCFTPFFNKQSGRPVVPHNSFIPYEVAPKQDNPQKACQVNDVGCG